MMGQLFLRLGFSFLLCSQTLAANANSHKISRELLEKLKAGEIHEPQGQQDTDSFYEMVSEELVEQTVVVTLEDDYLPLGLQTDTDQSTAINFLQGQVLQGIEDTVLARYNNLNGFSAKLSPQQITDMADRPEVKSVDLMPVHTISDAQSHPLAGIGAAHSFGYTGEGQVIAILDDGIDHEHPTFRGYAGIPYPSPKIIGGYDFADYDADPTIDCVFQSHGTAVAGVAAGDGLGVTGTAPKAKIVALKLQSSGQCGTGWIDGDVTAALDWIIDYTRAGNRIDVINMSFGGGQYSTVCDDGSLYSQAIQRVHDEGIAIFASSGNDGWCDGLRRPACFSPVISVGASYDENFGSQGWCVSGDSCAPGKIEHGGCTTGYAAFEQALADNVIVYSNSASFLDLIAPATCAHSSYPKRSITQCFGGTSSSSPFAAGVGALVRQASGGAPVNVRQILQDTGDIVIDPKNGRATPRVNALNAVSFVGTEKPSTSPSGVPTGTPSESVSPSGTPTASPSVSLTPSTSPSDSPSSTCGVEDHLMECRTTQDCQGMYPTAFDCLNWKDGVQLSVCMCGDPLNAEVCGCLEPESPTVSPSPTSIECGVEDYEMECTTTEECQGMYDTAFDCVNWFEGVQVGVCMCGVAENPDVCGCLEPEKRYLRA